MTSYQGGEGGQPVLRAAQPDGVGIDTGGVGRQLLRELRGEHGGLLRPRGQRRQLGVVRTRGLEHAAGERQLLQGVRRVAGVVTGEGLLRLRRRGAQVVGVGQPLDLGSQGLRLAGFRSDGLDLGQPEPEQLGLAGALPGLGGQLCSVSRTSRHCAHSERNRSRAASTGSPA